jgi:hypothetical protein
VIKCRYREEFAAKKIMGEEKEDIELCTAEMITLEFIS